MEFAREMNQSICSRKKGLNLDRCVAAVLILLVWNTSTHAAVGSWTGDGPNLGSITCLVFDPGVPTILYAGTQGGGVQKSTNRGGTWSPINNGLTVSNIDILVIDPSDSQRLYACAGTKLFKSTNAGGSWVPIGSGLPDFLINAIAVDPYDGNILYISVGNNWNGGLFKSMNGGESWIRTTFSPYSVSSVLIPLGQPVTVFAGGGGGVFKSMGEGEDWKSSSYGMSQSTVFGLVADPKISQTIYALAWEIGPNLKVFKSTDRGRRWQPIIGGVSDFAISPTNPDIMYAGWANSVFRSLNGGQTWTAINPDTPNQLSFLVADPQDPFTVYAGTYSGAVIKNTSVPGTSASIEVTSPNKGEQWQVGSTQTISWNSTGVSGSVKIELVIDGYTSAIISPSAPNSGSYLWTIPDKVSNQCRVRITGVAGGVTDSNDMDFSIYIPDNPPAITFVEPSNGATISGTALVRTNQSDDKGIRLIELFLDGTKIYYWYGQDYDIPLDTIPLPNGTHSLVARAYDSIDQTKDASISVIVNNPDGGPLNTWILPSSARIGGAYGTFWTTDLTLANSGDVTAAVALKFLGNNEDGTGGPEKSITILPGRSLFLPDFLQTVFGLSSGFGAVRISSSTPDLKVLSQTSTPAEQGTFGQSVPAAGASDWITQKTPRYLIGVREDSSFRTNLILANATATSVPVQVEFIPDTGLSDWLMKTYTLPPLGMIQISHVLRDMGYSSEIRDGQMFLITTDPKGAVACYASVIDNISGDPRTLLPLGGLTSLMPSSARAVGANGTFWTTDLTISNTDNSATNIALKFLEHDQVSQLSPEALFPLGPGQTVTLVDVLDSVFGLDSNYGAISIKSFEPGVIVMGQTSTPGSHGTYGQSVPAVTASDLITPSSPRSILGVSENPSFRSNLVLSNSGDTSVDVSVTLISEEGQNLGSKRYTLPPFGMTQVTRVIRDLGVNQAISGCRLLLSTSTPNGAFAAYVALIDNLSGDPRTLLPR